MEILDCRSCEWRRARVILEMECDPQPNMDGLYGGIFEVEYGIHPFSNSCFKGTPAEGLGVDDHMVWLHIDHCGNVVGTAELDWLRFQLQPGASMSVDGGDMVVSKAKAVWSHDRTAWVWKLELESKR